MLPAPTTVVTLPDGRVVAADDVGDPDGAPVLYLHGAPDCRLARHPDDALAAAAGVRLVALDRPGYGRTDPQPGRPHVRGWGADVEALLDALGIRRCRVLAWSAGAPWAFGLAATLGDRVERVVTYGAVAPFEGLADTAVAAASGPRAGLASEVLGGADAAGLAADLASVLVPPSPVDIATAREIVLESYDERARAEVGSVPGAVEWMATSLAAAIDRHGDAGLRADLVVQYSPGLLDVLGDVRADVVLVHGEHDPIAGPAVGAWLAARLADARVDVWAGAGHHALLPRWTDVLSLTVKP